MNVTAQTPPSRWAATAACTAIMLAEGFDLLVYSNAIPSLLADPSMGIDKADAGNIGSMAFAGMLLGGLAAGRTVAALGLVRVALGGFVAFTAATTAAALVGMGWQLGALRFVAGLGLGLVLPTALALARADVQPRHGALAISIVMAGLPLGGMLAALVAREVLPLAGWRPLFLAGGALGLVLLLVIAPVLARSGRTAAVSVGAETDKDWRAVFRRSARPVLLIGLLATLADLLTWYGISTWLTQLMREFRIPLDGALQLMFTLNIGAIIGSLATAALAIRLGTRRVAIGAGVVAATCLLLIAAQSLSGWGLFAVIALLGMTAISAQNLVNALVADAFPARHRAAAIGVTLGIGRLGAVIAPALGGQILARGYGPSRVLIAFAISALVGALLLFGLNRARIDACLKDME